MKRYNYVCRIRQIDVLPGMLACNCPLHCGAVLKATNKAAMLSHIRDEVRRMRALGPSPAYLQTEISLCYFGRKFEREEYTAYMVAPHNERIYEIVEVPTGFHNRCYRDTQHKAAVIILS